MNVLYIGSSNTASAAEGGHWRQHNVGIVRRVVAARPLSSQYTAQHETTSVACCGPTSHQRLSLFCQTHAHTRCHLAMSGTGAVSAGATHRFSATFDIFVGGGGL